MKNIKLVLNINRSSKHRIGFESKELFVMKISHNEFRKIYEKIIWL